ncbi:ornithine carbamoyltransferase [Thermicanus aegyptius]|uniref:ornithine carbamoyltransferase n=1 Tax=Thermicanus aegyptius TaxID=94009 RepID=UPI0012EC427D|nr:ornithine carbamoyltransferase [Thermicanus aegyptius]
MGTAFQSAEIVKNERKRLGTSFKGKDFLKLSDFTPSEIHLLLEEAARLKRMKKEGIPHPFLAGKILGMIFEKSSTRTRVSFEAGMIQLGGNAIFLSSRDLQLGRGESIHDTGKVLSRYVDGIMIRTYSHEMVEELAREATVPVINGLTDTHHPTQVLADLLTIKEVKGDLKGLKVAFVGDGKNNMAHSLLEGAALTGMHLVIGTPAGFEPDPEIFHQAKRISSMTEGSVQVTTSPEEAVAEADVVITDVWASMGQEEESEKRKILLAPYQVNSRLVQYAKSDYIFLHCLPAHRGEEVTEEIIDGDHSVVFEEAENRLHAHKAILHLFMGT